MLSEGVPLRGNGARPRHLAQAVKARTCVSNSSLSLHTARLFATLGRSAKNNRRVLAVGIWGGGDCRAKVLVH